MTENFSSESFRLSSGGLFYNILNRMHIQLPGHYSIKRRVLVFTTLCWLPIFLLAALEGNLLNHNLEIPFIYDLTTYVRFLIIVPLLIVVDALIDPLIDSNLLSIGSSGVIGTEDETAYKKAVERFRQRKDSYLADGMILLIIAVLVISYLYNLEDTVFSNASTRWSISQINNEPQLTYAGWWFLLVSSPILNILLFRWFWRFYLWAEFLFRVSRIQLNLQPTHPDMAGGLGILKNGEHAFVLLFIAFGASLSVSLAEEMLYHGMTLIQAQPVIAIYIACSIVIMTLPLAFFSGQLIQTKRWGRVVYGSLGYRLSQAFDDKWGNPKDKARGEELLKTADASAVCDYSDVYEVVREMHYIPIRLRDLAAQVVMLTVPFAPLIFIEVPVTEVFKRIIDAMI